MQTTLIIIAVVLIFLVGFVIWLGISLSNLRRDAASVRDIGDLKTAQQQTSDILKSTLLAGQTSLTQSLQSSQQVLGQLNMQIGELQGTNKQMLTLGSDVKRLQEILASPKLRGQLGEWSLENLLKSILPADGFRLQSPFRDGQRVDALVKLADFSVPIDAKFPMPAFEAFAKAQTDDERTKARRQFQKDVTIHIDKISSNYIRPTEGTVDFALMFIPAENVYYETIIKYPDDNRDILKESLDKKVIPVSPNLLYAYLMTVAMGLHGLQIEKQADEILRNLKKLNASFTEFGGNWEVLGRHLKNAYSQYEEGQKKLDRFGISLNQIQEKSEHSDEG